MENTPLEFPGEHPVKVMGRHSPEFRERVFGVLHELGKPPRPESVAERPSRDGTYLSLTFEVWVASRDDLDGIYRALHATGLVIYAL